MPGPVAAEPPSADGRPHDDAAVARRQPPAHLGRAYRIAFVETGALDVVLPATEQIPVQRAAGAARPAADRSVLTTTRSVLMTTTGAPSLVAGSARTPAPAAADPAVVPARERQLARRSRALLLGLAIGVVIGVVAVVVAVAAASSLGLLPR